MPEADSAPTWFARFSIGSGNIGRVERYAKLSRARKRYGLRVGYTLVNREDPSIESFRGVFLKVRRALGTTALGINEVRFPAGFEGVEHDEVETGHEEIYIVLEGGGTFTVDGEPVAVVGGDYLRVDAGATRKAEAGPDGLTFVVVAARPQTEYDGRASL